MLLAPACGGEEARDDSRLLPSDLGASFADRSDSVRVSLEAGKTCKARRQAGQLRQAVERAIEQNRVPPALRGELRRRSSALYDSIVCERPPPAPPPPPITSEGDEEGEEDD